MTPRCAFDTYELDVPGRFADILDDRNTQETQIWMKMHAKKEH